MKRRIAASRPGVWQRRRPRFRWTGSPSLFTRREWYALRTLLRERLLSWFFRKPAGVQCASFLVVAGDLVQSGFLGDHLLLNVLAGDLHSQIGRASCRERV